MTNTVFGRLNYNFDTDKFGGAIDLSQDAKNNLNNFSTISKTEDWMTTDIANGPISQTSYYRNPVLNVSNDIISSMTTLAATANSQQAPYRVRFYDSALGNNLTHSAASNRIAEMYRFISHTANVSGTATSSYQSPNIPTLDSVTALGNQMIMVLNQTNGIQNTIGALGAMTSLFIEKELKANNDIISLYSQEIINSLEVQSIGIGLFANTCTLSNSRIQEMVTTLDNLSNFVNTRRNHDWNFYQKSFQVASENAFLHRFGNTSLSPAQTILLRDYIGSDKLKERINLANT